MQLDWMQILGWLVAGVIGAFGLVKVVLPYMAKAWVEAKRDQQEFAQAQQSDAFKQALNINETLIKFFISSFEQLTASINDIDKRLDAIGQIASRANTETTVANRERVQMQEMINDVDLMLHENRSMLIALLGEDMAKRAISNTGKHDEAN